MKINRVLVSGVTALAAFVWSAAGQWIAYPSHGVPRTPEGKPNLSAPTPRTADGKPDLSGLWETAKNRPCGPDGCLDQQPSQEFLNIAWAFKEGLPYQPWSAALVKARTPEKRVDDPLAHCLPIGIVRLHTFVGFKKIIQTPQSVAILYEYNGSYRQIMTDGRPLPMDPSPAWNGYSIGKWEEDTLVVETIGFHDNEWLDMAGNPLSDAARITERFRRVNFGNLQIDITIDDAKTYTKPWMIKLNMILKLDSDLLDYTCIENEKDVQHFVGK